ncbi:MAG: hypothetical protein AUK31_01625 [Fibrobacteres bacterium CG2_30_45_31]|nr:MAG: hypothetical protein AUK31_01625 [Fibrobacteres bacterium CG2_30_45_31]
MESSSSIEFSSSSEQLNSSSGLSSSSVGISSSSSVETCTNTYGTNTVTDCRDNQTYMTVTIGTQTWMAENLNYAVDSSWCYENSVDNCAKYGRLYQWASAMDIDSAYNSATWGGSNANHQGICPDGWHVPWSSEWATLENYVGGSDNAGTYLKATSDWYDDGNDDNNAIDAYGFSALPGGDYRSNFGGVVGFLGDWWTATEYGSMRAYYRYMGYEYTDVYTDEGSKTYGLSLRCLKN